MCREKVMRYLREQFGVSENDLDLEFVGKENGKVYAKRADCKRVEIKMHRHYNGLYFGKLCKDGLRLSIEGSFIVGKFAKKNIIELDEEDAIKWMSGENLNIEAEGYVILKWGPYFLGCGKGDGKSIKNYVPKDRRLSYGNKRVSEDDG